MNEIARRFDYHPGAKKHQSTCIHVRSETKAVANLYADVLPNGREKEMAITKLEEALYWAIGAIVRPESSDGCSHLPIGSETELKFDSI